MISVLIKRNKKNEISEFEISGHAGAASFGKDIVCAAVSVLSQTMLLSLKEIVKINVDFKIREGYLFCKIPSDLNSQERCQANLLLETMIIGLKSIEKSYPEYIVFHNKEV